jgi:acyl-CoA synthetase (AMP-forming)/AMP-acid ligase II
VGRPILGEVAIKDDEGSVLRAGREGIIWFKGGERYEYRGDPVATAASQDRRDADGTWATLDDVGHVDDEGYLYLTDRRTHMIVSGGVNISPLEVENVLALHPRVDDVAVIGVPHPEYGEEVKALIKTAGPAPDADLVDELLAFCRARLSRQKCPRCVDFVDELPRLPTGKLAKHRLKERYWAGHATRVV